MTENTAILTMNTEAWNGISTHYIGLMPGLVLSIY